MEIKEVPVTLARRLNTAYFEGRLSPAAEAALAGLETAGADARELADRMFRLMRLARFEATDLSPFTAWLLGFSVPRTVPSAWRGAVPPVTMAGRHRKIDDYLATNPWHRPDTDPVFVDLGCGFPPFTTIETAHRFPGWRVIGVDPAFGRYLVHDAAGNYALFDSEDRLRYYQAGNYDPAPEASHARFHDLLRRLLPLLTESGEAVAEFGRLTRDPLRQYEKGNLGLRPGEIGAFELDGGADVIRCLNVLMYFDQDFRERALRWAARLLRPGGLFLCGSNWIDSASSRYTVYQKESGELVAREFAFSIENVRPIELAPWYALHDDNLENLRNAHAVGTLRADADFRRRFDARLDALLAELGVCPRGADGYLGDSAEGRAPDELARCSALLAERLDSEGFVDDAVAVLRRAGFEAWRNGAGHVAMRPVPPPALGPSLVPLDLNRT
ncbi:CheR family methyltransferase [Amycolatopsis anabasis]|uniref:CheR family methyltransferase n=1 Tax=Amycolatopsis anabasis TaxID=1840409 RepID=UPI00131BE801|nr:CheR family methyltransferase [Amycolatopsis anabasis]